MDSKTLIDTSVGLDPFIRDLVDFSDGLGSYVVYNCEASLKIHTIQNPERLGWEPLVKIEHYHIRADKILKAAD